MAIFTLSSFAIQATDKFDEKALWLEDFGINQGWASNNVNPRYVADVNGDNKDDIIGFGAESVFVSLSNGEGFEEKQAWINDFGYNKTWYSFGLNPRHLADVNGDGKADIIGFGADDVFVSLSNGNGFDEKQVWLSDFGHNKTWYSFDQNPRYLADVNGDGKADIVGFGGSSVYVSLSNGTSFEEKPIWINDFGINQTWYTFNQNPRFLADINDDYKADIIGFGGSSVYVSLSNGSGFDPKQIWLNDFTSAQTWNTQHINPRMFGKFDRCNGMDLVGFASTSTFISFSTGSNFSDKVKGIDDFGIEKTWYNFDKNPRLTGDINGDGVDDIIGFGAQGIWVSTAKL